MGSLFQKFVARAEYDSRRWHMVCSVCGNKKSYYALGGIRVAAASIGKSQLLLCSVCRQQRCFKVQWFELDEETGKPIDKSSGRAAPMLEGMADGMSEEDIHLRWMNFLIYTLRASMFFGTVIFLLGIKSVLFSGVFALTGIQIMLTFYAATFAGACLILRGDLLPALIQPGAARYGRHHLGWTWKQHWMLLPGVAVLWGVPVLAGLMVGIELRPVPSTEWLVQKILIQLLLVAAAEELFFREAALKAFAGNLAFLYLFSTIAFAMVHSHQGMAATLIAVAGGTIFLALRVAGVSLLPIIALHATSNVVFSSLVKINFTSSNLWIYIAVYLSAAMLLLATIHITLKKEF